MCCELLADDVVTVVGVSGGGFFGGVVNVVGNSCGGDFLGGGVVVKVGGLVGAGGVIILGAVSYTHLTLPTKRIV